MDQKLLKEKTYRNNWKILSEMDGASTQSIYSQRFDDTDLAFGIENEQSWFQAAIVVLKLETGDTTA